MKGVLFNDKHSYRDFGLILTSKTIPQPDPKKILVDIPGADGAVDLTETLTGDVKFQNRMLTFTFTVIDPIKNWWNKYSDVANYLHGQRMKIIIDVDKSFYYIGRLGINEWASDKRTATLVIEGEVQPYKFDRFSSLEDWEWDPFNFVNGIIQDFRNLEVDGELLVRVIGRRKRVTPIIECDSEMYVIFKDTIYTLTPGKSQLLNVVIEEGENFLTFIGNGTVSIDYRGGSL